MERDLTLKEARQILAEWRDLNRCITSQRDWKIRTAADAGLSVTEIAMLLEIGRSTVYRALEKPR